jgi:hypothetical protein
MRRDHSTVFAISRTDVEHHDTDDQEVDKEGAGALVRVSERPLRHGLIVTHNIHPC